MGPDECRIRFEHTRAEQLAGQLRGEVNVGAFGRAAGQRVDDRGAGPCVFLHRADLSPAPGRLEGRLPEGRRARTLHVAGVERQLITERRGRDVYAVVPAPWLGVAIAIDLEETG